MTHNHTNQDSRDTNSHLSTGDIIASNTVGKPVYVITPNGTQDRYRPSDQPTIKGRMNDPGVIERLRGGKWDKVEGAKPDIRNNPAVDRRIYQ